MVRAGLELCKQSSGVVLDTSNPVHLGRATNLHWTPGGGGRAGFLQPIATAAAAPASVAVNGGGSMEGIRQRRACWAGTL